MNQYEITDSDIQCIEFAINFLTGGSQRELSTLVMGEDKCVTCLHDLRKKLKKIMSQKTKAAIPATVGGLRLGNLEELPPELREELRISDSDRLEMEIIEIMEDFGGVAQIDEILVALWRKFGRILKRDYLARKMYRMVKYGVVENTRRRGVYALKVDDDRLTQGENQE